MKNSIIKYINNIAKTIILSMIVFVAFSPTVFAGDLSQDLTDSIRYKTNNGVWAGSTIDDNYQSYWYTKEAAYKYLQIDSDKLIKHLYICYAFKPNELVIQTSEDSKEWMDVETEVSDEFYHVTYTFDTPTKHIRIKGTEKSKGKFGIVEFKVFTEGTLPDYIQSWKPTHEKTDILIFSAHPDDEAVFFSGVIPYYAGEKNKKATVVYMTASDPCRRSEALNYLWAMHERNLPMFAYFPDLFEQDTYNYTKSIWGEQKTIDYLVSVIRQKKPDVIVSHDTNGEYGHGNHMFTAKCLQEAVVLANDPEYHEESYIEYGIHEIKKLYLHLYEENKIDMDVFDEPLDEYDGLTAIEAAQVGIQQYASQLKYSVVRVHDRESEFSCYNYGLAYTTVGYDKKNNDMFENIDIEPTPTVEPTSTPKPTVKATAMITPTSTAIPSSGSNISISNISIIVICIISGLVLIAVIFLIVTIVKKQKKS